VPVSSIFVLPRVKGALQLIPAAEPQQNDDDDSEGEAETQTQSQQLLHPPSAAAASSSSNGHGHGVLVDGAALSELASSPQPFAFSSPAVGDLDVHLPLTPAEQHTSQLTDSDRED